MPIYKNLRFSLFYYDLQNLSASVAYMKTNWTAVIF